jgi:hypothetical protein
MKSYEDMTRQELLECISMASEDEYEQAKRQRWTKLVLTEWLNGYAELTDECVEVADEPDAKVTQTDNVRTESINGKRISVVIDGKIVERKATTYARSRRSWIRCGKGTYFEVIVQDNGTYVGVPWQD